MDGREEASESTSFVSRLFNFRSSTELKKKEEERQEAAPLNNINELQVLQGHTDIVRVLLKIDEQRLASASDDAKIIIWNHTTGEKLMVLEKGGHTVQVTCLLLLGRNKLASGSSDKTIKIWDLTTGECKRTLTAHQGSIKCLCMLPNNQFCSGANDRQLCVWSLDGELLGTIERQEEESIQQ
jgi:WD40 repeat protein